ncbi:MAG: protein-L-isoaspartate(D-aspartate) O-methyltransferase [Myxococcota bacterium]
MRSAGLAMGVALLVMACGGGSTSESRGGEPVRDDEYAYERERMVTLQIEARGVADERVLRAMRRVRRHRFTPDIDPARAYDDHPHPIGEGQTISQPYIVALMSEAAHLRPPCRVLEVGTGSGYQAAVLAEMGCEVFSIEIVEPLARSARGFLEAEGYGDRVHVRAGDGYRGWPEQAPFDAILVTAAVPRLPQPLLDQLAPGGRLVVPVGEYWQVLEVHERTPDGFSRRALSDVRFVPMTGEIRRRGEPD